MYEQVLRLVATLLVLIFLKKECSASFDIDLATPGYKGHLLRDEQGWNSALSKTLNWIRGVEKRIPCMYSRLELGANWEDAMENMWLGNRTVLVK